jgi:uncharacterized membrane protein (UPF0127 family)
MNIRIKNNIFNTKLAISPKEREIGMMNKVFDETFDSMLFIQNNEHSCFWMKNCVIPLDIIFIKDNVINKIFHNCPPCKGNDCEHYCAEGDMVLELFGGSAKKIGIEIGDRLEMSF